MHMHHTGHERIHGTDVIEVALAIELALKLVVGIQAFRREALVIAHHGVGRLVTIGPNDRRPGRNIDLLGRKRELADGELDLGSGRRGARAKRRHDERDSGASANPADDAEKG